MSAAAPPAGGFLFDPARCLAFDVECYPGRWCVGFYGPDDNGRMRTMIVETRDDLERLLRRLADRGRTLVGYNSAHFDVPVIRAVLAGFDPYAVGQAIIREQPLPIPSGKLPPFPCDHIDLSARLRRGGSIPSLKQVAAYLGRPVLRELPYPPGAVLDDAQWEEVKRYNEIDLAHTWALAEQSSPELQALAALSEEQGDDLRSTPTPKVVETVFKRAFARKHQGRTPPTPEAPQEVIYRPPAGVRRPRTAEAAAWYDRVVGVPLSVKDQGGQPKVDVPRATLEAGGVRLTVGAGGVHSVDGRRLYYATPKHALVSVDVSSFYPSLIAAKGIVPRSYGDTGAETYRDLLRRRLEVKAQARDAADPAERERLDVQATALKLVLNSTFGKFGDLYSSLFDPAAMLAVTLTGQLMLIDLVERLREAGARVLSVNTDGLFLKVKRTNKRWRKVLDEWQAETEMVLEVEPLRRFLTLATNRYATLDARGKVKRRGDGLKGKLSPFNPPNDLVVADAVAEALLRDVPPERTVRSCADPVRFCRVTRRTGKVVSAALVDEADGTETELPKVVRWYRARGSTQKIRHRFADGRHTTPSQATGVALALDLADGRVPDDVDRTWYTARARKVIQSVPGYHHRSRRRLLGHPLALEVHARGLAPCPKHGKAQPAGSDATRPTFLYQWDEYETTGTYTGPAVGILALDVDEARKFSQAVDKNNSPLLANRWAGFAGCLVSVRGGATAEGVRAGRDRGKLIFRFEADADHPLARLRIGHWKESRGVEVFYGKGIPSVLGRHPDGDSYRLEGTLGPPPEWLVDWLTPRPRQGSARPREPRPPRGDGEPEDVPDGARDALLDELEGLDGRLGRATAGWRSKALADGRTIWVGRCPFEHESGRSNDADIAAGFDETGIPYVRCQHASCDESREVNDRLRERHPSPIWGMVVEAAGPSRFRPPADAPEIEPTPIAAAVVEDLAHRFVTRHVAPTGAGKSYGIAQAAAVRYRQGLATLIALPTIRLAEEAVERLKQFAPDAFAADAVAKVYGGARLSLDDEWAGDTGDEAEADDGGGEYPIHDGTRIVIATHAQLGRRGFSRYLRGIWAKLGADEEEERPAFAIIIDEVGEYIRESRREIALAHRTGTKGEPDGSGGVVLVRERCPKFSRSGNCGNCSLVRHGGVARFNRYNIRELRRPPAIELDGEGHKLRRPRTPLRVTDPDLRVGPKVRVGHTTFAAPVLAAWGKPLDAGTRRTAAMWLFAGEQEREPNSDVLAHMLEFALTPVVTWEHPVNEAGEIVQSRTLAYRLAQEDKKWDDGVVFPRETCEVPRLRFTDLIGLEQIRRFAHQEGVGVIFAGATLGPGDAEALRAVWPKMAERHHPYPPRKIRRVAIVAPEGYRGGDSLIGADRRLITAPLEGHGLGLVFCATRGTAEALHEAIALAQPTAALAAENYEQTVLRQTLHGPDDIKTLVTYSRGVLGLGANVLGVRHLLVDANAFRSIASFTPGEVTPERFEQLRAEERLSVVLQNLGRALRGEEGKTVVLIVLNADRPFLDALRDSPGVVEGSELPPLVVTGKDLVALVDQAGRWLASGGGDWPAPDPAKKGPKPGRPGGKTRDDLLREAEAAVSAGMSWREFSQKYQPKRKLSKEELDTLKARFSRPRV